jgi:hypothetical protein
MNLDPYHLVVFCFLFKRKLFIFNFFKNNMKRGEEKKKEFKKKKKVSSPISFYFLV